MDDSVQVEMNDAHHVHSTSDDDIQQYVDNMVRMATSIKEKVMANVDQAQDKQKQQYAKRKMHGVKVFQFKVGDEVGLITALLQFVMNLFVLCHKSSHCEKR